MQLNQIGIRITGLVVLSLLVGDAAIGAAITFQNETAPLASVLPNGALPKADERPPSYTREGRDGDYAYELWRSWNGADYYLYVWFRDEFRTRYPSWSHEFESGRAALAYFDQK
ncbi:MAG: hypothetical protein VKK04_23850 [Synechococcales bacterium]|nr:hypothetical protein [Synechococcales bacterium]